MTLSRLGSLTHILVALLIPVWWTAIERQTVSPGLLAICALMGLLPDIDSQTSTIGRLVPEVSRQIERRFGHRTLTHSLLAMAMLVGVFRLITPDWGILAAAYGSHILLDMVIGGNTGVTLLWPWSARFKVGHIDPASTGEMAITGLAGLLIIVPLLAPTTASQVQAVIPKLSAPTLTPLPPPPVPTLVSMRIQHVFDQAREILVQVGQPVRKGQPVADLVQWRATLVASGQPSATPTWILYPTQTPSATATPYSPPTVNPLVLAAAWNELQLARAQATLAAAPPSAEEIQRCQSTLEGMRNDLWSAQLARDAAKIKANEPGANVPWESIGAMEAKLFDREREIAEQEQRCTELRAKEHTASPEELAIQAVQLQKAELRYAQVIATQPPPLTPTPTATATPTNSPTPQPTTDTSETYASSVISGTVHAVKIVGSDGHESTVQIDVVIGYGVNSGQIAGQAGPGRGELATVTHVRDGDTLEVRFSDGTEEVIRLLDVDTPETLHPTLGVQCYGPEASHHTKEKLCGNETGSNCLGIEVQIEAADKDKYGRTLGYVWLNGELYNEELTWLGLARYNDYGTKHQHSDRVAQAAAAAQATGLGLWGACGSGALPTAPAP